MEKNYKQFQSKLCLQVNLFQGIPDTYLIMIWLMLPAKGQLISEWLFDVLNNLTQKFDKFLPKNLKSGQIIR